MINKIYASDMDGTFLREDHSFDKERFRRILESVQRKRLFICGSKWAIYAKPETCF